MPTANGPASPIGTATVVRPCSSSSTLTDPRLPDRAELVEIALDLRDRARRVGEERPRSEDRTHVPVRQRGERKPRARGRVQTEGATHPARDPDHPRSVDLADHVDAVGQAARTEDRRLAALVGELLEERAGSADRRDVGVGGPPETDQLVAEHPAGAPRNALREPRVGERRDESPHRRHGQPRGAGELGGRRTLAPHGERTQDLDRALQRLVAPQAGSVARHRAECRTSDSPLQVIG